jgi:hypothetical protein
MAATLLEIVETTEDGTLRERAARVLCRQLDPTLALRIARAAKGDRHIFQSLLGTEGAADVAGFLVESGRFTMGQYGVEEAGRQGRVPDRFVPERFPGADGKTRLELLRLAEAQLAERGDEALHRFVMNVVFGSHDAPTRAAAWWSLHRWYRLLGEHRGEGPFRLEPAPIARFFGSVDAFVPRLADLLRDSATLKEVGLYEFLAHLFREADPAIATPDLVRALLETVRGEYWAYLVDAMIDYLGAAGADPRWREEVLAGLESLGKKGNYHWDRAVRRLRLSAHGVPDEPEWAKLPSDFVPKRFAGATPEGRLVLLRVAEEQLIHGEHPSLLRFLLQAAFGAPEAEARAEAMRVWSDRGGRPFRLSRAAVEREAGPWKLFLESVARALRAGEHEEFLRELLREPCDPEAAEVDEFVEALRARGGHERLLAKLRPEPPPIAVATPSPIADDSARKAKEAERLGKELQEAAMRISFGPGSPEEKTREIMRLQAEFQERVRKLYGA